MFSRAHRNVLSDWWWTVDRLMLAALLALMLVGIVLGLAGSPAVAHRLGYDSFHFVNRQIFYLSIAVPVLIFFSMLSPRNVWRLALVILLGSLILLSAVPFIGAEVKGARRWIEFPFLGTVQPSEFLKPAFVVVSAWLFSESVKRPDMPANLLAFGLLGVVVTLLIMQPDIGQTALLSAAWAGMFFIAGLRIVWVLGLGGVAVTGLAAAYAFVPHVTKRFEKFLNPEGHDNFQVDTAIESFVHGGWLGQGPGEGTVKRILPDSHTDFIFAVAAEEFGIVLCLALAGLFAFIILRGLFHAYDDDNGFVRLATAGLVMLFGLQASINIMVNLHLIPAKGMTLPFISYGGSSLVSLAIGTGMLLALTRRRVDAG